MSFKWVLSLKPARVYPGNKARVLKPTGFMPTLENRAYVYVPIRNKIGNPGSITIIAITNYHHMFQM